MDDGFRLFPESASTFSPRVDQAYLFLLAVSLFFTILICSLILYFGIRYRQGSPASRANPANSILLEVTWSIIPLLLTMVMFGWGASIYFDMQTPPPDVQGINVVARQWMWKLQHPEGRSELNELHVPIGQPIQLRMISEDVIHSFYIPAFRIKQDVLPGSYTRMWFEATKPGRYHLFCAEYCGTEHSLMRGRIVVMEPEDYANWLAGRTGASPEVAGKELFERYRCQSCHKPSGGIGPNLIGIFGTKAPLQQGGAVTVDEEYLRTSILDPAKQIVAGYRPEMPSFRGQLDEQQILQLIAYLKSNVPDTQQTSPSTEDEQ